MSKLWAASKERGGGEKGCQKYRPGRGKKHINQKGSKKCERRVNGADKACYFSLRKQKSDRRGISRDRGGGGQNVNKDMFLFYVCEGNIVSLLLAA